MTHTQKNPKKRILLECMCYFSLWDKLAAYALRWVRCKGDWDIISPVHGLSSLKNDFCDVI